MIKITLVVAGLLLCAGCCTTYKSADGEPATKYFMGSRCEATSAISLPREQRHWFNIKLDSACEKPPSVEVENGTILRIDHFERVGDSLWLVVTASAEVESGPAKGARVVIGQLFGDWNPPVLEFYNPVENLQRETGAQLQAVDPAQRSRMLSYHGSVSAHHPSESSE